MLLIQHTEELTAPLSKRSSSLGSVSSGGSSSPTDPRLQGLGSYNPTPVIPTPRYPVILLSHYPVIPLSRYSFIRYSFIRYPVIPLSRYSFIRYPIIPLSRYSFIRYPVIPLSHYPNIPVFPDSRYSVIPLSRNLLTLHPPTLPPQILFLAI